MIHQARGELEFVVRGTEALESIDRKMSAIASTSRWTTVATTITAVTSSFSALQPILAGVASVAGKLVSAAADDIDAFQRLDRTLARTGITGKAAIESVHTEVERLRRLTPFGDEDLARGLDRFILQVGDAKAAVQNFSLVTDVAARLTGGDMAQAAKIVSFAMDGYLTQLQRALPDVKEFSAEHKGLEGSVEAARFAIEMLTAKVGGGAAEERNTLRGAVAGLKSEWGELQETFGKKLLGDDTADTVTQINMLTLAVRDLNDTVANSKVGGGVGDAIRSMLWAVAPNQMFAAYGAQGYLDRLRDRARAESQPPPVSADKFAVTANGADPGGGSSRAPGSPWSQWGPLGPSDYGPLGYGPETNPYGAPRSRMKNQAAQYYEQVTDAAQKSDRARAVSAQEANRLIADSWNNLSTRSQAAIVASQAAIRAAVSATAKLTESLLLRENAVRMRGLDVIKYVTESAAAAALRGIASVAMQKGTEALGQEWLNLSFLGVPAAGLKAAAIFFGLAGVASGAAGAIESRAQKNFDRFDSRSSGGAASGSSSGAGGSASPGSRIVQAGAAPSAINYIVNVSYQGSVIYGNGGTREWFERELLPLIREARQMGALAAA